VAALETDVAHLKTKVAQEESRGDLPWWEQIFGAFEDDPLFEEAMALGRAYRESLRPRDDEEIAPD